MSSGDRDYAGEESQNETFAQGTDTVDNSYASRTGQNQIPVVKDDAAIEAGAQGDVDQDSDQMLERDDADAIDQSNIIEGRTRGAKPSGGYREPGDEEGLPGPEDGTSAVRG